MALDIKEYIDNISPEKFEELCVSYLRYLKGTKFKIKGTRYCKDGGKDIEGVAANDIPYEIWAECKKHGRSIGLDEISKNVVLVLSENINELIFFSTSNITAGAQKHISNLAARHNFSVAYYYGEKLLLGLSELPLFRNKKVLHYNKDFDKKILTVNIKLSKYSNSDRYESKATVVLQRDTVFYIDIYFTNNSSKIIKDINIDVPCSKFMLFNMQPYNKHFDLQPYCDRIVQIKVNVINCIRKHIIPHIKIQYEYNKEKKTDSLYVGTVDPTHLMYFPLVGVELNKFLKLTVEPLLKTPNPNVYIIDVRGGSGVGKSRLIKELLLIGEEYNWHIKHYDGNNNRDLKIIKDLLCSFIGLPFYNGNINFTSKEIKKILKSQGDNEDFADVLYDFIYKNKSNDEILYYIEDAILYLLKRPYSDYPYILSIDNLQEIDISVLDILEHLIGILRNTAAKFIIILGINIERIPSKNQEKLTDFLNVLDCYDDDYRLYKELYPMDYMCAKTFYSGLLKNIQNHEVLLNFLVNKAGTRPFDMIMQLKYLQEKQILSWQEGNSWYIQNFDKFDAFENEIPLKSNELIRRRVQAQLTLNKDDNTGGFYQKCFKTLVKCLMIFKDNLPIEFMQYINMDEEIVMELMNSLFFKYDENDPEIHFYHNNLYLYFSKQKIYLYDSKLIKKVTMWLEKENSIKNKDVILLDCYIRLKRYEIAKIKGVECLKNAFSNYNYSDAVSIAKLLLSTKKFNLKEDEHFEVKLLLANAYCGRIDHEKGAQLYFELFKKLKEKSTLLPEQEKNKFYHKAINANLNSNHPDLALIVLNDFKETKITVPFYKLILYDRLAVVYLALGKIDCAEYNIDQALKMAEKENNSEWKGIVYSDYAYLQYRAYQCPSKTYEYFMNAFNTQFPYITYKNRIGELLQQKSFAELLKGNFKTALTDVNKSIETCQKIHSTYLEAKAINLKGIIQILSNDQQKGVETWSKGIDLCQEIKNLPSKIRMYCNIGAYYLAENNIRYAKDNLLISYQLFLENHFSEMHYKELFYNLIRLYYITDENTEIEKIMENSSNNYIEEFYNIVVEQGISSEYGILFYKKCNFIF